MSEPDSTERITWSTLAYRVGRRLCWLELRIWHRLRVRGREHLPEGGPFLLVANHQSFLDIPIVAAALMDRHVCFVARESLANFRPLGWLMRRSGAILIRRGSSDRAALTEMVEHLRAGDLVCVYPEGTRSPDGSLREFLPGALFAAKRARVPIVPVAIQGAHRALPRGGVFPRPARITLRFGPPVDGARKDAMDAARTWIAGVIEGA